MFRVSNAKGRAGAHGQFATRGHGIVLSYPFDPGLAAVLPRLPAEMGHVVLRSRGRALGEGGFLDFRLRRVVVEALYEFNRLTKPRYGFCPPLAEAGPSADRLEQLSQAADAGGGSILDALPSVFVAEEEEEEGDEDGGGEEEEEAAAAGAWRRQRGLCS